MVTRTSVSTLKLKNFTLFGEKMIIKEIIHTQNAPQAIGTYSQAVKVNRTVYLSGQIPLMPLTMTMVEGDINAQITQVFENLKAVTHAAGGSLNDIVKLNVFLTDLSHFPIVNEIMGKYFHEPYPARAAIGVAALPKDAGVEMDGIMEIPVQEYA
jgi:reactive intermediate/imine deaminase